jgi:thioredoxin reductase (NADPH)
MITADEMRLIPLFAALPAHERETIAAQAADISVRAGDWLIQEGESPSFFAVLAGQFSVSKFMGDEDRQIDTYGPGTFFGEVPLLLGSPAVASIRALTPARVMRLEAPEFRHLVSLCAKLNEEVGHEMVRRVNRISALATGPQPKLVALVGRRWDLQCHDLRDFMARNHIPFDWLDPEDAQPDPQSTLLPGEEYPVIVLTNGERLSDPSFRKLADRLGLQTTTEPNAEYDVAIVGAGPAGLAAAVYGASEGLRTLVIEREAPGGQAGTSSRIENYLGFPAGLSGDDLSTRALRQAKRFGAEVLVARDVIDYELTKAGPHRIVLDGGDRIAIKSLVLATGVSWRKIAAEGADLLIGRGVYYGAARTEALGTRGHDIYLVGGGNSAGQAAMFFSGYAKSVTILIRAESLAKSMSQYLIDQLATRDNVNVETHVHIVSVAGDNHLESIVLENVETKERRTLATDSLFIFIGADAETDSLPEVIVRDGKGYVCTGRDVLDIPGALVDWPLERDPYLLETSVPGVFAAGDVRHGSIKRVASGVGEGSMSIAFIHRHLEELASQAAVASQR